MRAALSIVLAGLLVTTPLKLVLAQAGQQEMSERATDSAATSPITPDRIGVPVVQGRAALLWQAASLKPMAADSLAYSPPFRRDISPGAKVVALLVMGFVLFLVVYALVGGEEKYTGFI